VPVPAVPDNGTVPEQRCADHAPSDLDGLRTWAWERGRTDIVLDLDLHEAAWGFHRTGDRAQLARLSELLVPHPARSPLDAEIHRLAAGGPDPGDRHALRAALLPWCGDLCTRVAADLDEVPGAG